MPCRPCPAAQPRVDVLDRRQRKPARIGLMLSPLTGAATMRWRNIGHLVIITTLCRPAENTLPGHSPRSCPLASGPFKLL
jgi:hypothetical protein